MPGTCQRDFHEKHFEISDAVHPCPDNFLVPAFWKSPPQAAIFFVSK